MGTVSATLVDGYKTLDGNSRNTVAPTVDATISLDVLIMTTCHAAFGRWQREELGRLNLWLDAFFKGDDVAAGLVPPSAELTHLARDNDVHAPDSFDPTINGSAADRRFGVPEDHQRRRRFRG